VSVIDAFVDAGVAPRRAASDSASSWRWRLSLALMAASGFAGLGWQIIWTRQCALWLGHEAAAVLAVVAAFFGGLALGAHLAGPRIERSAHPARWYAACEATIALWGAVLLVAMAPASARILAIVGSDSGPAWQWTVAFVATLAMLLPATMAMGATLPAIERVFVSRPHGRRSIAAHYACNTAGAVLGVLATAFWLVPALGLARTAAICVALNIVCAVVAMMALSPGRVVAPPGGGTAFATPTLATLFCTGLLGIGFEVLVVRVLSQVAEDTVYTFAILLAVYLAGTTVGAAAHARSTSRGAGDRTRATDRLLAALAAACLLGTLALYGAEALRAVMLANGGGFATALAAEAAISLAAFALPTVAMGALFSELAARAHAEGASFGRALAVNTAGAAFAPIAFGVVIAPLFGAKVSLVVVVLGYLALAERASWRSPAIAGSALAALVLAVLAPRLAFVDVPEGGRVVELREGVTAAVSVVEDARGVATLRIDNRQQEGSSATLFVDARQALLPVLLHPAPRRALFLGLGTGVTAAVAAADPTLAVDAVELVPEVIEASRQFAHVVPEGAARLHVVAADARRFVRTTDRRYDVVVADNFHPARSGSAALYTVEHFRAVRERLAASGVFCQWLPLHQLDRATLQSIVRSFVAVYPQAFAILVSNSLETPVLGLVALDDGARLDPAVLRQRIATAAGTLRPGAFAVDDELALLGGVIAGPRSLAAFARDAVANTDDRPIVATLAPRVVYAGDAAEPPATRLLALLAELAVAPDEIVAASTDPAWSRRLAAYWSARDRFLAAGVGVVPSADARAMLAQLRVPLLDVVSTSADFRPAYDPLLKMAIAIAPDDAAAARAVLEALAARAPQRPEAAAALLRLPR
jgi:spermidine synthase